MSSLGPTYQILKDWTLVDTRGLACWYVYHATQGRVFGPDTLMACQDYIEERLLHDS